MHKEIAHPYQVSLKVLCLYDRLCNEKYQHQSKRLSICTVSANCCNLCIMSKRTVIWARGRDHISPKKKAYDRSRKKSKFWTPCSQKPRRGRNCQWSMDATCRPLCALCSRKKRLEVLLSKMETPQRSDCAKATTKSSSKQSPSGFSSWGQRTQSLAVLESMFSENKCFLWHIHCYLRDFSKEIEVGTMHLGQTRISAQNFLARSMCTYPGFTVHKSFHSQKVRN